MAEQSLELLSDDSGVKRCWWCGHDPLYVEYHDREWGRPVYDDKKLFEKICLEGFQAGLSWITILRKREAFREAFQSFEFAKVAKFNQRKVESLVKNAEIVRHRGKIESTINNAKQAIILIDELGSLANYFWGFAPKRRTRIKRRGDVQAISEQSTALSKDLKRRGWTFVGPTTCYAFMQSMGMVNDHLDKCHVWQEIEHLHKQK